MGKDVWGVHMPWDLGLTPIDNNFVAIGWPAMGKLDAIKKSRDAFKEAIGKNYPETKHGAIPTSAGVLYRFTHEIKTGDVVIFPSKPNRMVNIGLVDGGYEYDQEPFKDYPNHRRVNWVKSIPRANFSQGALNEIGSAITLFKVTTNADEFIAALDGKELNAEEIDEAVANSVAVQVEESTEDFIIKRLKNDQTPYQFEHFVAHLLKCMGYHANVTKASGDGGIDIIAHKDELGFEPPIIKVQCKQILSTIGRPDVQQLHGAIEAGEHGLFVTLGSFSSEARAFERTKPNLKLLDATALINLIYEHYHKFEPRYQLLLPLRKSYVPAPLS